MLALIDCNNFFVSCERLFNPRLKGQPVVVLSGDNGCIIARSQEAKKLGIPMGAPYFEWASLCSKYGVHTLSSNFALYLDMSERVMQTVRRFSPEVEVYSVDEAFISLADIPAEKLYAYAQEIRRTVYQWTGIPASIGVSSTKTLAKVATHFAKPRKDGVCVLEEEKREACLARLPVGEIWGVGARIAAKLKAKHIYTALQLAQMQDVPLRKSFGVVGLRLAMELRGIVCCTLYEKHEKKQSISTAKALVPPLTALQDLLAIVAGDVASVAVKLRRQQELASYIVVMLVAAEDKVSPRYIQKASKPFFEPTSYTPHLISTAKELFQTIYKEGLLYKKVGILLGGFVPETGARQHLFDRISHEQRQKELRLMHLCDRVNEKYGKKTVYFAAEEKRPNRSTKRTPQYTTEWNEILSVD
ncbi:MAG: Y-family DNA polymerase [Verrucomicrobia bacterium]|nr:Y-family DNA polymerase [Verrucomicrobiota bacterium]